MDEQRKWFVEYNVGFEATVDPFASQVTQEDPRLHVSHDDLPFRYELGRVYA